MTIVHIHPAASLAEENAALFSDIAKDIEERGYSIKPAALPDELALLLHNHVVQMSQHKFHNAGIGRGKGHTRSRFVRSDEICWITGESRAGALWLEWAEQFMQYMNRHLYLGLFQFESHFAHYKKGDFYKLHLDSFKGMANRILSIVVYLNPGWLPEDGGELVLYHPDDFEKGIKVTPLMGTVVTFLSEEFPHEVLASQRDRYSIAGWFRLNASTGNRVDPEQ